MLPWLLAAAVGEPAHTNLKPYVKQLTNESVCHSKLAVSPTFTQTSKPICQGLPRQSKQYSTTKRSFLRVGEPPSVPFHCECMTMCPIPCNEMLLFASIKKSSGPLQKEPEGRNERTAEAKRNFFLSAEPTFRSPPMGPEGKMSKPLKPNGTFRSAHPLRPYNI